EVGQVAGHDALPGLRVGDGDAVVEAQVEAFAQVGPQRRADAARRAGDEDERTPGRFGHGRAPPPSVGPEWPGSLGGLIARLPRSPRAARRTTGLVPDAR